MRAIFLAIMAAFLVSGHARAQSFDCATIKTVAARLICGDPELAKADVEMAKAFKAVLDRLTGPDKDAFLKDQTNWERSRNTCCGLDRFQKEPLSELRRQSPACCRRWRSERLKSPRRRKQPRPSQRRPPKRWQSPRRKRLPSSPRARRAIPATHPAGQPETAQPAAKSQTFCRYKWFDGAEAKLTVLVDRRRRQGLQ